MSFVESASDGFESIKLGPLKCRDGSRPNILLAEDSPAARVLTGALLNRIGCDVDAAEHGEEALGFIKDREYDLILMDIEMPVMDGVVAAKEIRKMGGAAAKTPIVALSAFLADTQKSAFWQKHFDIALAKPAGKLQLHAVIRQVLDLQPDCDKNVPGVQLKQKPVLQDVETEKLARILSNICDADKELLLIAASEEIAKYADCLANELVAGDDKSMAGTLHKLIGLSATFAATALYDGVIRLRENITKNNEPELSRQVMLICDCARKTVAVLQKMAAQVSV